jgi:hypothetical protein
MGLKAPFYPSFLKYRIVVLFSAEVEAAAVPEEVMVVVSQNSFK